MVMRKLDSFEWLLICLILATFITGIMVALARNDRKAAIPKRYPVVALCR
ncbi:hypothetical protein QF042_002286 [Pedobacter sp. W3I1]|nr:hypothetical protein [Pedobacter sp. W3I1]